LIQGLAAVQAKVCGRKNAKGKKPEWRGLGIEADHQELLEGSSQILEQEEERVSYRSRRLMSTRR